MTELQSLFISVEPIEVNVCFKIVSENLCMLLFEQCSYNEKHSDQVKIMFSKIQPSFFGSIFMWTSKYITDSSVQVTVMCIKAAHNCNIIIPSGNFN